MSTAVVRAITAGPKQEHIDALRQLLDLIENFSDNDQRARYLLSSNWMRDNGAEAAEHNAESLAEFRLMCSSWALQRENAA